MNTRSFVASMVVLAALMLLAGVLTLVVPAGSYQRAVDANGAELVVPGSYVQGAGPEYPVWRWLTAPLEVLASEDAALAIVIIVFITVVGGAFALLRDAGILEESVRLLAERYKTRRRLLLAVLCLFFMATGSFMGVFEEVVPLVPLAIALSLSFGWDVFMGLGMSILAVGFGFSAAIANPFSIGTAQKLSGVPVLSGSGFRIIVFLCVYALYMAFMLGYVRKLEKNRVAGEPAPVITRAASGSIASGSVGKGVGFFGWSSLVLAVLVAVSSITRIASDYILPIIALGFLIIGTGAGLSAGTKPGVALRAFGAGALAVLPAGILILMALSVKRIVVAGGIMDTVLFAAGNLLSGTTQYGAAALMYIVVLGMEFFVGSASAKAFLLMPILGPLADLSGLSRQIAVQAFAFGDGFSNMLYPTNAVLLISLGLAGMSWGQWFRRTWKLQALTFLLTMGLLMVAVAFGYR